MCFNGEEYQLYHSKKVKAKTQHRCDECGREINKGEEYVSATGLYDARWYGHKTCLHCRVAQGWLIDNCGGFAHHILFEEIDEHAEEYPNIRFGMLRLKVGMNRKWKRFNGAGLMVIPKPPKNISIDN